MTALAADNMLIRMVALNRRAKQMGREAMEKSLTAAARVRRRMKVGRPITNNEALTALQALYKSAEELNKARSLMSDENLDPEDIRCELVYALNTRPIQLGRRVLPPPDRISQFFKFFEQKKEKVVFLGMAWQLKDHEVRDGTPFNVWFAPLTTKPTDHVLLVMAGKWILDPSYKPTWPLEDE